MTAVPQPPEEATEVEVKLPQNLRWCSNCNGDRVHDGDQCSHCGYRDTATARQDAVIRSAASRAGQRLFTDVFLGIRLKE